MNELPDESFVVDAGRRIKLTPSDKDGQRLLDEACQLYKQCCAEHRGGHLRNLTLTRFENAQRRLKNHLLGRELQRTEKAVRKGKQA